MPLNWNAAQLPLAKMPTTQPIDWQPFVSGVNAFAKQQKDAQDQAIRQAAGAKIAAGDTTGAENELFNAGYLDQGINLQNTAATQKRNAAQDQALVVNRAGGLAQIGIKEADPNRKAAILNRIYALDPKMKDSISADGVDLSNPDAVFQYVQNEAAGYKGYQNPEDVEAKRLGLDKTRAEISKLNAESANVGSAYGKAGTVVQGSDGRFYSIQFGSGGQRKIEPLELGGTPTAALSNPASAAAPPVALTPARGVGVEGNLMYDKATGAPVRDVGANVAAGKSAQVQGEAQGKAASALPLAENSARRMLGAIDTLTGPNSGLDRVTGTIYGRLPEWTNISEEAKNAQSQIDYVNSNTFLQAYNDLRGAGAITEKEGEAAQKAYNRLRSQQLGTDAYRKALIDFRNEVVQLRDIARAKAAGSYVTGSASGTLPNAADQTKVLNGKTYTKINGQWFEQ